MKAETEHLFEHYGDILRARGLAERSITYYQYSLKGFVGFLGDRSLGNATSEDIVSYQIQLGSDKASDSRIHVATHALPRFLRFALELDDWNGARLPLRREPVRLPVVLSPKEIGAIFDAAASLNHRAGFMLCYGSGLLTDEMLHIKPRHIDSKRMVITKHVTPRSLRHPFATHLGPGHSLARRSDTAGPHELEPRWTPKTGH